MKRAEPLDEFLDRDRRDAVEVNRLGLGNGVAQVLDLRESVLLVMRRVLERLDCGREGIDHVFRLVLGLPVRGEKGIESFIAGRLGNGGVE